MHIAKKATLLLLVALIAIPSTSMAFSLDDAVKQWMEYAKARIAALEKENEELRAQLRSSSVDVKDEEKDEKNVKSNKDLGVTIRKIRQTSYSDDDGGVYGSYEIELAVKAGPKKIYIATTTNDAVGTDLIGFTYSIKGDNFKGTQESKVSCSPIYKDKYCSVSAGKTRIITVTVLLKPSSQTEGTYAVSFDSLHYFTDVDGDKKTLQLNKSKTAAIKLYNKSNPKMTVTANPASVEYGGSATINWAADGARSCTLNSSPILMAPTGSTTTGSLLNSTKYSVTCFYEDRFASQSVLVEVQPWQPPAGYKVLPGEECTISKAPCVSPGGFTLCEKKGCSRGG